MGDETSETFIATDESTGHSRESERAAALPSIATGWLDARAHEGFVELRIEAAVVSGRAILRVGLGASVSAMELPTKTDATAQDLVGSVRRWARMRGHGSRVESLRAGELCVVISARRD